MITFGLTGGIASGKSTVTKTFRAHNIPIVDADIVSREVVEVGSPGLQSVIDCFGSDYLTDEKTLDRVKLSSLVFHDAEAMRQINSIMGPLIAHESARQIDALHDEGSLIVGYDAALICEMGLAKKYSPLIVVACPREMQLQRLMKRNSLNEDQANARINAQMSAEDKIKLADYVIDTSGEMVSSVNQTIKIIEQLKSSFIDSE